MLVVSRYFSAICWLADLVAPARRELLAVVAQCLQAADLFFACGAVFLAGDFLLQCLQRELDFLRAGIGRSDGFVGLFALLLRLQHRVVAAAQYQRIVVLACLGEFPRTGRELRTGADAGQLRLLVADAGGEVVALFAQRGDAFLDAAALFAQGFQTRLAEACLFLRGVASAAAFAQITLTRDPVFAARQLGTGHGIFHAARAFQCAQQPFRHGLGEAHHFQQRTFGGKTRRHAVRHDEVAVAQLFAQRHRGFRVLLFCEQHDVRGRCEHGFHGGLPGWIGNFHHVGEQVMRDTGLGQSLAESGDILRIGTATCGEVLQHLVELAQFLFLFGDAHQQIGAFAFHVFDLARVGELAAFAGLRLLFQALLLFDDGFPAPEFAVEFVQRALLVLLVVGGGLAAQLRGFQRLLLHLQFQLQFLALDALGAPFFAHGLQGAPRVVGLALQQVVFQGAGAFRKTGRCAPG